MARTGMSGRVRVGEHTLLLALMLVVGAGVAAGMNTPFETIPLPRSVTQMEGRLGVSDNEMPDHTHTVSKGRLALSGYDQSILAGGPPPSGDGPRPAGMAPAAAAPQYAPSPQYAQPAYAPPQAYAPAPQGYAPAPQAGYTGYAQPAYAQPAYAQPAYAPQQGYAQQAAPEYEQAPQQGEYQGYAPGAQPAQQGPYAYPQQQQASYSSYPQQQAPTAPQAAMSSYYDFSQAQGQLGGANADIASAASFTEGGKGNGNSRLGWHPTLEREMGVPKKDRTGVSRKSQMSLRGDLASMKKMAKPVTKSGSPSTDPTQVSVAAQQLAKARMLLKKSLSQGLHLHGDKELEQATDGESPCTTLACEKDRFNKREAADKARKNESLKEQHDQALTSAQHRVEAARHRMAQKDRMAQKAQTSGSEGGGQEHAPVEVAPGGSEVAAKMRAAAHEALATKGRGGYHFQIPVFEKAAAGKVDGKSRHPVSGMAIGVIFTALAAFLTIGGVLAHTHAKKLKHRSQALAMGSFT